MNKNLFFLVLPQLKNGWTFPCSLTDRNGALHPDQLTLPLKRDKSCSGSTLPDARDRLIKSSYRFWFVWIVFIVFLSLSGEFCAMITGARLGLNWRWLGVVEIFSFEISISVTDILRIPKPAVSKRTICLFTLEIQTLYV